MLTLAEHCLLRIVDIVTCSNHRCLSHIALSTDNPCCSLTSIHYWNVEKELRRLDRRVLLAIISYMFVQPHPGDPFIDGVRSKSSVDHVYRAFYKDVTPVAIFASLISIS
jgi:hypothetical protein